MFGRKQESIAQRLEEVYCNLRLIWNLGEAMGVWGRIGGVLSGGQQGCGQSIVLGGLSDVVMKVVVDGAWYREKWAGAAAWCLLGGNGRRGACSVATEGSKTRELWEFLQA